MSVDIGGHLDVGMAHPFLNIFEGKSGVDQQAGTAVPLWHNKDKSDKPLRRNGLNGLSLFFFH